MKILTVSNCHLVAHQGSGYIVTNFCHELNKRGHDVDLFGPDDFELFKLMRGHARSYRQALGMVYFLLCQLRRKSYDIIEIYGAEGWLAILLLKLLYPSRKFLLISHSNGLETYVADIMNSYLDALEQPRKWYQLNQSRLFISAFTQVDGLVTVSQCERNFGLQHRYQDERHIIAIENCLPNEFLGISTNFQRDSIIGFCGSWIPRKGIKLIISDIAQLLLDFPTFRFRLIGVGDDFRKEEFFPRQILSQIEVIPFVNDKAKLRRLYESLSIVIVPSFYESFGLVAAEAMACGCAVITSSIGFAASLENNKEVMILPELKSPFLYTLTKKLLLDEPFRLKIAVAGYQCVQRLKWDSAGDTLTKTYQDWLEEFRSTK